MNLNITIKKFFENCRQRGLSSHTIRAYSTDLRSFSNHIGNNINISNVDKKKINLWIEYLQNTYKPRSVKRKIAVVKAVFNWLLLEDYIDFNPFSKIRSKIQQPQNLPRNISNTDLSLLFSTLNSLLKDPSQTKFQEHNLKTLKLAILLLVTTGIRVSELCSIRIQDIDLFSNTVRIFGKGSRERNVFIVGDEISTYIQEYISLRKYAYTEHNFLLVTHFGKRSTPSFIRYHLNRVINKNRLSKKITPHMFRHTTATSLLDRGVDIRHVQKLLGHSSINTTVIYTHVSDVGLKNAVCSAHLENITGFG